MYEKFNTVFILGAGASATSNVPLMDNFIETSRKILLKESDKPEIAEYRESFENVYNYIENLQQIHSKAFLDLRNIETLFGMIELGLMVGIPHRKKQDIEKMRSDLITLIVKTIEFSGLIQYFKNKAQTTINSPNDYRVLGEIISSLVKSKLHDISIISFNYDLLLDIQLSSIEIPFDYCLNAEKSTSKIPFLKLHGSINWAKNSETKLLDYIDAFNYEPRDHILGQHSDFPWLIGSRIISKKYSNLVGLPILIPPTWNKTEYQKVLETVWQVAMAKLSKAENIIFIGYSLPESDMFFKYLYSISCYSLNVINKVFVINPDHLAVQRIKNILGRDIVENKFKDYGNAGTTAAYDYLGNDLQNLVNL